MCLVVAAVFGYFFYEYISFQSLESQCRQRSLQRITEAGKIITIYFVTSQSGRDFNELERDLSALSNTESVTITSATDALASFKQRHVGDTLALQALDELGMNPFGPSIMITFRDFSQLSASHDAVIEQIKNLLAKHSLSADKIMDRVENTLIGIETYEKKSFGSNTLLYSSPKLYYQMKQILKECTTEESFPPTG